MNHYCWRLSSSGRLLDVLRKRIGSSTSARSLKRSLEANACRVNGQIERFASSFVPKGALIELVLPLEEKRCSALPSILYEDEHLLVLNKPAGTLCSDASLRQLLKRPQLFLGHRLDKDTTGVLLCAKNEKQAEKIHTLFEQRNMQKEYLALVDGIPSQKFGTIKNYLSRKRSFQGQTIWGSNPAQQGFFAETTWKLFSIHGDRSLLSCSPKTGRTHQIRVHLAEMGHPILIDRQYASHFRSKRLASRPLLHAWRLQFVWNGTELLFEAPVPDDLHEANSSR